MRSRTRFGSFTLDGENGVTKQHVFPEKNPKFTPRFTASVQWSYCLRLQYSSCPTDRKALHRVIVSRPLCTSSLLQYVTSYPCCSSQYANGNSNSRNSPEPSDSGLSVTCG